MLGVEATVHIGSEGKALMVITGLGIAERGVANVEIKYEQKMLACLEIVPVPGLHLNRNWGFRMPKRMMPEGRGQSLSERSQMSKARWRFPARKPLEGSAKLVNGRLFSAASAVRTAFGMAATKVGSIGVEADREEDMALAAVDTTGEEDGRVGPELEGSKTLAERLLLVSLVVTPSNDMANKKRFWWGCCLRLLWLLGTQPIP